MTPGLAEAPILVLGLGNLLLGDDGVGLLLLEELARRAPGGGDIEFIDGGTQGLALLGRIANRAALIVLDAVAAGAPPGTVHVIGGREALALGASGGGRTAHEGNAGELLAVAALLGELPGQVTVIGIEPARLDTQVGLSAPVLSGMEEALETARRVIEQARVRISDACPEIGRTVHDALYA